MKFPPYFVLAAIAGLYLVASEMDYQDMVKAPTAADYRAMRCEYLQGDPDCKQPEAPKVANN